MVAGCAPMYGTNTAGPAVPTPANPLIARAGTNEPLLAGHERPEFDLYPRTEQAPLVLMSISGGGSRSAYYAARVMEELSQVSSPAGSGGALLDDVRVISTVSAGGLAASWYTVHHKQRRDPDFFQRFKEAMGVNLQWRTYGHMAMFPPLALQLVASGITRTDLLANEIEKLIADGQPLTFNDLWNAENDPDDPTPSLIINGTIYNSGQRLVMTNFAPSRFPSLLGESSSLAVSPSDSALLSSLVQPLTFEDFGSDIGRFRLAQAVAASAAYPIVLAPFRLQVFSPFVPPRAAGRASNELLASEFLHIADGGLYENEGVDALLSLVKSLDRKQPILLIIIDASQRMETVKAEKHKIWDPITVISRMYDIGTMRPLAFYSAMVNEFHDADKLKAVVIRMEGYDPETEARLKNIPTTFKLGEKHRQALDQAATQNVAYMKESLLTAYQSLMPKQKSKKSKAVTAR